MGKNAAFGRPRVDDRLRTWWYSQDKSTRTNALLFVVVGAVVVALFSAATSGDAARTAGVVNGVRPRPVATVPPMTTPGGLGAAAAPLTVPDTSTSSTSTSTSTTTSTTAPARAVPAASSPATPTTAAVAATTIPDVVVTEVPATTAPPTTAPVATISPTPTAPATTTPRPSSTTTTPPSGARPGG